MGKVYLNRQVPHLNRLNLIVFATTGLLNRPAFDLVSPPAITQVSTYINLLPTGTHQVHARGCILWRNKSACSHRVRKIPTPSQTIFALRWRDLTFKENFPEGLHSILERHDRRGPESDLRYILSLELSEIPFARAFALLWYQLLLFSLDFAPHCLFRFLSHVRR